MVEAAAAADVVVADVVVHTLLVVEAELTQTEMGTAEENGLLPRILVNLLRRLTRKFIVPARFADGTMKTEDTPLAVMTNMSTRQPLI